MSYHDITCYVQRQLQNVGQPVFTCCKHRIDSQVLVGKHVKTCGNMLNRDDTGYISPVSTLCIGKVKGNSSHESVKVIWFYIRGWGKVLKLALK